MRLLAMPLALLAVVRPAATQSPYRVSWRDAATVGVAVAAAVIPAAAGLPHGAPSCAPCDPASLPGIDHAALHTFSGSAATASSVLLAGMVGLSGVASLDGATPAQVRGHAVVFANSLAWTLAATEWLKVLTQRNRPVLYTAAASAAASDADSRRSFPSGHASLAFAAASSYLVMARREGLPHRTRNAVLLYAGALGVSVLRVSAGKHFPTDVAAGAALGSGIGWLAARVHPTAPPSRP
jgi:membrane-associated phospholipid phosphatase